ncbi:bifunctional aminoglycoside phosphotransferase/ATP-binding protein [Nocardioides dilutus]
MSNGSPELAAEPYAVTHLTHSGVVFMVGDRAYKLKRPIQLGFLDFTEVDRRREVCLRELSLNRRLTPDVYLGLGAIQDPISGAEPVVVMRRLPAARRLASLVRRGVDVDEHLGRLARQLAIFHTHAARSPEIGAEGTCDAIRQRWTDSFDQVRGSGSMLDPDVVDEIERLTLQFLDGRSRLFEARVAAGRVVDGHGDLLAEDIFCLDDGPRVLDCLEFDDRLRHLDQLDDVCCLAMDLERLGASSAAASFIETYLELTGDTAPPALLHHFIAYRAFVRAKVGCLPGAAGAIADAALHARLCLDHLRWGAVRLVVVGGAPGCGKTTLAAGVADRLGFVTINSDRVRKELAGVDPERSASDAFGAGLYTPEWSRRTYDEMLRRAGLLLSMGESVVLDATWGHGEQRQQVVELADDISAELVVFECVLPAEEADRRISARVGVSDADADIARRLRDQMTPWPGGHRVDTLREPRQCIEFVCAALGHGSRPPVLRRPPTVLDVREP